MDFWQKLIYLIKVFNCNKRIDGKVVIITGGNSGIGKATAKELVRRGAKVIIGCRNVESGYEVLNELKRENTEYELIILPLDLSSLVSVRWFAKIVCERQQQIDILINNAGIMDSPLVITKEGFELHFVTNYLGHFLLTLLLINKLKNSINARIVNVSSILHYFGNISLDDLNQTKHYFELRAYGQSKLAQILFTRELAKRVRYLNINSYAVNPGMVRTKLSRNLELDLIENHSRKRLKYLRQLTKSAMSVSLTPEMGAQTTLYCALDENTQYESGYYYSNCKRVIYMANKATDDLMAHQLWEKSCDLVQIDDSFRFTE